MSTLVSIKTKVISRIADIKFGASEVFRNQSKTYFPWLPAPNIKMLSCCSPGTKTSIFDNKENEKIYFNKPCMMVFTINMHLFSEKVALKEQ